MNPGFDKLKRSLPVETADLRAVPSETERFSVKTKVTLVATVLFLLSLLLVSAVQLYYVKAEMKTVLAEQQHALVVRVADELDQKLVVNRDFVEAGTKTIPPEFIEDVGRLQKWAAERHGLRAIFSDVFVISAKGAVLADTPPRGRHRNSCRHSTRTAPRRVPRFRCPSSWSATGSLIGKRAVLPLKR